MTIKTISVDAIRPMPKSTDRAMCGVELELHIDAAAKTIYVKRPGDKPLYGCTGHLQIDGDVLNVVSYRGVVLLRDVRWLAEEVALLREWRGEAEPQAEEAPAQVAQQRACDIPAVATVALHEDAPVETKIHPDTPKTLRRWLERNPGKVADAYQGVEYSSDTGFGYDWLLAPGYCVAGEPGLHTIIVYTVKDMLEALNNIEPCHCSERCGGPEEDAEPQEEAPQSEDPARMGAHCAIDLAKAHLGKGDMVSSAELCVSDAERAYQGGSYGIAVTDAQRSLAYSVGVLHPDYQRVASGEFGTDIPF